MPWWVDVLDLTGLLVAVILLYGISLMVRRRLLARHGGTFELSHRIGEESSGRDAESDPLVGPAGSWVLGLGRYSGEELEWFRIFSLAPSPKRRWMRSQLSYDQAREAGPGERTVLYPDHVVVTCGSPNGELDLAMSRASLTGFQAWLESRTPGTDWTA